MRLTKEWTDWEDRTVTRMWKAGKPASEIGAMVGRTKDMVIGRSRTLKLGPHISYKAKPWTSDEDGVLTYSWKIGRPISEISKKTGRTSRAVASRARLLRLGIHPFWFGTSRTA